MYLETLQIVSSPPVVTENKKQNKKQKTPNTQKEPREDISCSITLDKIKEKKIMTAEEPSITMDQEKDKRSLRKNKRKTVIALTMNIRKRIIKEEEITDKCQQQQLSC